MTDTTLAGPHADDYELSDRYRATSGRVFLTGIQALARLPIEQLRRDRHAGLNTAAFLSGYPGSPLGGLDQEVARARELVPDLAIVHEPAVNEELGATAVMGSQLAAGRPDARYEGVVGFWYGKAPGLDRAGDALRHGVFAGSSPLGGAVVLVGDDPDCKSSTMPSSSDATLVDLHMPILYPGTAAECLELGLHAVAISRASGLWASMKIVTPVADGSSTVTLPVPPASVVMPTIDVDGRPWVSHPSAKFLGPRMLDVEREFREIRLPLAQQYGIANELNRVSVDSADAWIGLVATGFTYNELLDALRRLGLETEAAIADAGIRLLQLRMPVPFDADLVRRFASGLDEIVVVEEKNPTLEWLVKDALYGGPDQPRVVGKTDPDGHPLLRAWGRLDADAMLPGLRRRLAVRLDQRIAPLDVARPALRQHIPLSVNRTPFFCSGCPHNHGTKVPDGALVGAGTGCHGMSLLMDDDRVGEGIGITAMGNEGAQWVGMEPFVDADHIFQNYGDGTFFHSAQLAMQYCIGADKHITFKILYNDTVAMTGGQDATFALAVPDLVEVLLRWGVRQVAITADDTDRYRGVALPDGVAVHDRSRIVEVQAELRQQPGVTVLIHDQACAAELRRGRRRGTVSTPRTRIVINHRVCEGCGDCGDVSNCLSVQPVDTPLGRKTQIDQATCNFDYSCVAGDCPAFMEIDLTNGVRHHSSGAGLLDDLSPIPEPAMGHVDHLRVRMAGIGGTGVVTVAQVLATAAMLDGWDVRGLDQTGLSQKAGPVISDVVLARPGVASSNLVGGGQADVLIGFDELVAAADGALAATHPNRTAIVTSTVHTPTGRMISHPDIAYPDDEVRDRLQAAGDPVTSRAVAAGPLAEGLVGSAAQANVLLLGVAYQLGVLPVAASSIERAIDLNGVAVAANLAAFDWGRRWVVDAADTERRAALPTAQANFPVTVPDLPAELSARIGGAVGDPVGRALVELLAADLIGHSNVAAAERFVEVVARVAAADARVAPADAGGSGRLTAAAARGLHRFMAYKDEYEVARLLLLTDDEPAVAALGGAVRRITWKLHPPMLEAMGLRNKIGIGRWGRPVLAALRASKRLRGTPLDPFGRTVMRRTERALIDEYIAILDVVATEVTADTYEQAVALAELADRVRGYEELKLRRVAEFRADAAAALTVFT